MFLVNSRLGHFTAAIFRWHPFSRTYGVILPSSLTIVLSLTLGFSPHLPVSVCGTGTYSLLIYLCRFAVRAPTVSLAAFLDSVKSAASEILLPITAHPCIVRICLHYGPAAWTHSTNGALCLSFCVPTSFKRRSVVQESLPVVHRLRPSPSA